MARRDYQAQACGGCGVHPSAWSEKHGGDPRKPAVVPQWRYCRICDLIAQAEAAGPEAGKDAKGYHLVLAPIDKPTD